MSLASARPGGFPLWIWIVEAAVVALGLWAYGITGDVMILVWIVVGAGLLVLAAVLRARREADARRPDAVPCPACGTLNRPGAACRTCSVD